MDSTLSREQPDVQPPAGIPLPENKKFYPALDGLRAIAVLLVFSVHYIHQPDSIEWGWVGVDMFFVLSGFLITGILYDTRDTPHRYRNFYVRRTLRIFPLYYGVLLLTLLLTPVFRWDWNWGWLLWPLYLGNYARFVFGDYLVNQDLHEALHSLLPAAHGLGLQFTHFWSLCLEEQFYLVWPPVVYWVRDRVKLRNLCVAVVAITPLLRLACVHWLPPVLLYADFLYRFPPLRVDALLLGALVALCLRGEESGRVLRSGGVVALGAAGVLASLLAGVALRTHHAPSPSVASGWMSTIGFTLIDLLSAGVIVLALKPAGLLFRVLTAKPLRRLGQMSYGFYIFHFLLQGAFLALARYWFGDRLRHLNVAVAGIGMVGSLAISYVSFRFFETPFLRLKDRFTA